MVELENELESKAVIFYKQSSYFIRIKFFGCMVG